MSGLTLLISLCSLVSEIRGDYSNRQGISDEISKHSGSVYASDEDSEHSYRPEDEIEVELPEKGASFEHSTKLANSTKPTLLQSMVDAINSMQNSWIASTDQPRIRGVTVGDLRSWPAPDSSDGDVGPPRRSSPLLTNLPPDFDARVKFRSCTSVIGHVRDQSYCGNCWAAAPVEVLNDRLCIESNGKFKESLSIGYVTSCCNTEHRCASSAGCTKGSLDEAMIFLLDYGTVTGSDYKPSKDLTEADGCWPYSFEMCNHSPSQASKYPECPDDIPPTPPCQSVCTNGKYKKNSLKEDIHTARRWERLDPAVQQIKQEIFEHGPVFCAFDMYKDFGLYKSGVYVHTTGDLVGSHTLKIIGWGVESGQEYWLAMNSWNEEWGDHGLIKMAVKKTGLEQKVYVIDPEIPEKSRSAV